MFSLDAQIKPYMDESFNAEVEAQHFFKSYGEADITKKLAEMSAIQQSIETVLRQKVRANYGMFLVANDEINQVDEEMSDLKHLINNTQKLIDVSSAYVTVLYKIMTNEATSLLNFNRTFKATELLSHEL